MVDLSQLVDLEGKVGVEEVSRLPLLEDLLDLGLDLQVPHEVHVTLKDGIVANVAKEKMIPETRGGKKAK